MGSTRICTCWHKYGQTTTITYTICLIILLFASPSSIFSTPSAFMAQGRPISSLSEVSDQENNNNNDKGMKEKGSLEGRKYQVIGSRPPRCEGRCSTCGKCVAVQVPVPQISHIIRRKRSHSSYYYYYSSSSSAITFSSRGDDLSNYKPMSWKCKCGDYIFNP